MKHETKIRLTVKGLIVDGLGGKIDDPDTLHKANRIVNTLTYFLSTHGIAIAVIDGKLGFCKS